ncbi:hypothetical protein EWM64_g8026 [Hericium alpestre]|uniref:Uncharacterized protein n=1 Tax=Hericium alpestre TaxID=135208 RepID=A0A4Y9ZM97_9AGAM|nr:hypothetical protein EWM64_g8026 [Hericium alpestre]
MNTFIAHCKTFGIDKSSVDTTISILHSLKTRYEVHHSVEICDSALVAAAVYSAWHIFDRFLSDKSIDLVDEDLQHEHEEVTALTVIWQKEHACLQCIKDINEKLEQAKHVLAVAQHQGQYELASLLDHPGVSRDNCPSRSTVILMQNLLKAIILLDKLEKAHKDVSMILLQILDENSITDSQGQKLDFKFLDSDILVHTIATDVNGVITPEAQNEVLVQTAKFFPPRLCAGLQQALEGINCAGSKWIVADCKGSSKLKDAVSMDKLENEGMLPLLMFEHIDGIEDIDNSMAWELEEEPGWPAIPSSWVYVCPPALAA